MSNRLSAQAEYWVLLAAVFGVGANVTDSAAVVALAGATALVAFGLFVRNEVVARG